MVQLNTSSSYGSRLNIENYINTNNYKVLPGLLALLKAKADVNIQTNVSYIGGVCILATYTDCHLLSIIFLIWIW